MSNFYFLSRRSSLISRPVDRNSSRKLKFRYAKFMIVYTFVTSIVLRHMEHPKEAWKSYWAANCVLLGWLSEKFGATTFAPSFFDFWRDISTFFWTSPDQNNIWLIVHIVLPLETLATMKIWMPNQSRRRFFLRYEQWRKSGLWKPFC